MQVIKLEEEHPALIRLTALWALSEAGMGGVMHLFSLPFTGVIVGGSAVLIITLIASMTDKPLIVIPRALLLVLIIKGMISPHSPITAYLAVSFQGLTGALLFRFLPSFRVAALLLGTLALMESALQKLFTLTIIFSMSLWESIDVFIDYILKKVGFLSENLSIQGSGWLVGTYVTVYLISGIFIGWLAGRLPEEVKKRAKNYVPLDIIPEDLNDQSKKKKRKSFWKKRSTRWTAYILVGLLLLYLFIPTARHLFTPVWLLMRVLGMIALWYFVLAPIFMRILQRFLHKKASAYQAEVDTALNLLPIFKYLAKAAWKDTRSIKGWRRWRELVIRIITYVLLYSPKKT